MKNSNLNLILPALLLTVLLSSCSAIAGIFKAGMGFGIFIVIAILVIVIGFIVKAGKK